MSRKLFAVLMSFILVATLLAACSGGNSGSSNTNTSTPPSSNTGGGSSGGSSSGGNTGGSTTPEPVNYGDTGGLQLPLVDKPTKISIMVASDVTNLNDSWFVKEVEKMTGIDLDIQAYPNASYSERLNVVVGAGDFPDIIHGLSLAQADELGGKGAFAAITDHLDQLPNFKSLYADNPDNDWVLKSYSDDSGKLYTWPIYGLNREVNHGFLYRKDIFDQHNIPLWTNTDEFYQALKKLKEIYPNSYPYASKTQAWIFRDWGYGWGVVGENYPAFYNEATGQWGLTYTQPEYKDMLDFMKKLLNEGLLDPEFITDTSANWEAKMTNDQSFVTFDWIGRLDLFYNLVKDSNPNYNMRYGNPVGPTNKIRSLPMISNFGHVVANNDKAEISMKLLDFFTSPLGAELMTVGLEGVNYELDANGKPVYPELKDHDLIEIKLLEQKYGMWVQGLYMRTDRRSVYYNYTEKEQEAQDMMKDMKHPLDPVLKFTDNETSTIAEYAQQLQKAGEEFSAQYIFNANSGDKEWNDWLARAKQLGEDKLVEAYNTAQSRFNAQ